MFEMIAAPAIQLGPQLTRRGGILQLWTQFSTDLWHEGERSLCRLNPLRFGGYLLLQHSTAYHD